MIGLPKLGRFGEPDIARDHGLEDAVAEVLAGVGGDLSRQVESGVEHGEQHTIDVQGRVERFLHALHRRHQLRKPLEREVLALQRNEQRVGRDEHVERDQRQRRRAIDEDVVVAIANGFKNLPHAQRPVQRSSTNSTSAPARSGVAGMMSRCLNWTPLTMASSTVGFAE